MGRGDGAAADAADVLDALPDGVVVADGSGIVTHVNATAAQLLRHTDEARGTGKHLSDVVTLQDRAGNDWFDCTKPYTGLSTRTQLSEQAWFLSDGTELLVTARIERADPRSPVARVVVCI